MGTIRPDPGTSVFAAMLEALPERLSRYRVADRVILYCNPSWAGGHHSSPAEMIGRSLDDVLTPPELEGLRIQLARLNTSQPLLADTEPRPAPEGGGRWIEWVDRLMDGPDGPEILSIGRDVTDRTDAERARHAIGEQLRVTMSRMADGLVLVDHDWAVVSANPAAVGMLSSDGEELVGRPLWDAFPPLRTAASRRSLERVGRDGEPLDIDRLHDTRNDTWFEVDAVPTDLGAVVFLHDVSTQVRREDALERAVATEQEAVESLQQLDRVKTAFLSAVSHELRTPFTVVYGLATTMQRMRDTLTPQERRELEDALVGQSDRVRGLLDDLLDVDRLARGTLRAARSQVDAAAIVRRTVDSWDYDGTVDLEVPDELLASVDGVLLERIVANLLENAAKYAPGASVRLCLAPTGRHGVRIEIDDTGPGIPSGELRRIFEPFHRVDDDHPRPGTGIGLALVSEFARIHGGRAWAEQTGDGGAHIVVELPGDDGDPRVASEHGPTEPAGP